ncbi:MAG: cytosine permease, partial [Candidatus Eremiobacteraeota bacterium]|nr:cytosine permease [Candidatus Eremiobacteraeota bacterium]
MEHRDAAIYGARVAEVEPFGIEPIAANERHGNPGDLFGLWFSANAETATWSVGILTAALYGTSLRGSIAGILIGNAVGYALLGLLSTFGPRWGLPQMMQSRLA